MGKEALLIALRVGVSCTVFIFFIYSSFRSRLRYSVPKTAVYVTLLTVITIAVTILFLIPGTWLAHYNVLGILLWIVLAEYILHKTIKRSSYEILFIVLAGLNLYANIFAIAKVIVETVDFKIPYDVVYAAIGLMILLIYVPLLYVLLYRCYRRVVEFEIRQSFWRFIWVIPAMTYIVYYEKIVVDYWSDPGDVDTRDVLFCILWSFITYILFWVTLQMLIRAYEGICAADQAKMITSQLRVQQEQYGYLLENIENTARLRHDWRHHLLTINGLVEKGDIEELRKYLGSLAPEYTKCGEVQVCQNHTVDAILRHYAAIAKPQGIKMSIKVDIPAKVNIADTDLCIIFGNLIENAVQASANQADSERFVEAAAQMKGRQLVVKVKNTYQNTVSVRDGVYYSTKHEGMGMGISSVKKIVEKYNGTIKIDNGKEFFSVYILMNTDTEPKRSEYA